VLPLVSRSLLADNPVEQRTESSTPPRALSSPSTMSFLRWSSVIVRCVAFPFATGAVVGPEGTVGACRLPVLMVLFKTSGGARVHRLETRNPRHGLQATMSRELRARSAISPLRMTRSAAGGMRGAG
jgi:hypothetical protein